MTYNAGAAQAAYLLDISQPRQAAAELRALFAGLKQQQTALVPPRTPTNAPGAGAADQQKTERAILSRANAEARLAQIQNTGANTLAGLTRAEQIYQQALAKVDQTGIAAIRTQGQLASVQNRIANQTSGIALPRTVESFGTQAIDQFKQGLLGIVGPAAVATAGIAALTATAQSFKDAFAFKAQLDATNLAIRTNLAGVRDQGQVFAQAAQFAARYRLTQQETSDILASSTDILRVSTASVGDLESALLRLQSRDVSKPVSEAARAVRELNSGDVTSIKELFNVPAKDALQMKNEIAGGADAVQVLTSYLDRAGVGMAVLENRSKGAAGAINEQRIAAEKLALAQAKFSEGPGVAFTDFKTNALKEFTAILTGDFTEIKARNAARIEGQNAYNLAIQQGKTDAEAMAIAQQVMANAERDAAVAAAGAATAHDRLKDDTIAVVDATRLSADALSKDAQEKLKSTIASAQLSAQQAQLDADSRRAAQGLLGAGDQAIILAQKYGIATTQAQFLIDQQQKLSNATALADQRKGEQTGTDLSAKQFDDFSKLARAGAEEAAADKKRADDKQKAEAARIQSAQNALALARATTKEQKIAELQRQQAATTDQAEKLQLQAQIEQEKRAGASRVGTAKSTALQLQNTEQNSQLQLLRTQREGLERLRDQQEDFDVRRTRSKEDQDKKVRGLLARGQIAEARRAQEEFALSSKRDQEDFDRQKRRTLRNNAEGTGDIDARTDLRQQQIGARAALRNGGAALGSSAPPASLGGAPRAAPQAVAQIVIQGLITMDGKAVGTGVWPTIEVLVDEELAVSLAALGAPGSTQQALAGVG